MVSNGEKHEALMATNIQGSVLECKESVLSDAEGVTASNTNFECTNLRFSNFKCPNFTSPKSTCTNFKPARNMKRHETLIAWNMNP